MGAFGGGEGKVYLNRIRCKGNESRVTECPLVIEKEGVFSDTEDLDVGMQFRVRGVWYRNYQRSSCWIHQDDAAVQCYDSG